MRGLDYRVNGLIASQEGISLVETLVALSILAISVTVIMTAFSTNSIALRKTDQRVTAETIARSQMEYSKSQNYVDAPTSYTPISSVPASYSVTANAIAIPGRDSNIQKITVTVQRNGQNVLIIEGYKLRD